MTGHRKPNSFKEVVEFGAFSDKSALRFENKVRQVYGGAGVQKRSIH
jgi:hypothetical protein